MMRDVGMKEPSAMLEGSQRWQCSSWRGIHSQVSGAAAKEKCFRQTEDLVLNSVSV